MATLIQAASDFRGECDALLINNRAVLTRQWERERLVPTLPRPLRRWLRVKMDSRCLSQKPAEITGDGCEVDGDGFPENYALGNGVSRNRRLRLMTPTAQTAR